MYSHNRNNRDLAEGTKIRITANNAISEKYFSVGDTGTILYKDSDGDYRVKFDDPAKLDAWVSDGGDLKMQSDYDCYSEFDVVGEIIDGQ